MRIVGKPLPCAPDAVCRREGNRWRVPGHRKATSMPDLEMDKCQSVCRVPIVIMAFAYLLQVLLLVAATWKPARTRIQHQDQWLEGRPYRGTYRLEHIPQLWTGHRQCHRCREQRALRSDRQWSTVAQWQRPKWRSAQPRQDAWAPGQVDTQLNASRRRCRWQLPARRETTTRDWEYVCLCWRGSCWSGVSSCGTYHKATSRGERQETWWAEDTCCSSCCQEAGASEEGISWLNAILDELRPHADEIRNISIAINYVNDVNLTLHCPQCSCAFPCQRHSSKVRPGPRQRLLLQRPCPLSRLQHSIQSVMQLIM